MCLKETMFFLTYKELPNFHYWNRAPVRLNEFNSSSLNSETFACQKVIIHIAFVLYKL